MPSIVAHSYATSAVRGERLMDMNLGSVLRDFASMYRDYHGEYVVVSGRDMAVDVGVNFHKLTDITYDKQPEIPKITGPLSAHLREVSLSPEAARLGAFFLADVLVDGYLLGENEALGAYVRLGEHALNGSAAMREDIFPQDFIAYVKGYFEHNIPWKYLYAEELADITQRRLYKRARSTEARQNKAFGEEMLPAVAEVIDVHMERAGRLGATALERTIEILIERENT